MSYVLITTGVHDWQGKWVLVSYARTPIWKSFENLYRQSDTPSMLNVTEGKRVLNKYANAEDHELITQQQFELEYSEFVNNKTESNG